VLVERTNPVLFHNLYKMFNKLQLVILIPRLNIDMILSQLNYFMIVNLCETLFTYDYS